MSKKSQQLRGQTLLDAIEKALIELTEENDKYIYNASELSRKIGCSRPTLNSKQDFIDSILQKVGGMKRLKREHPLIEQLNLSIEKLESENKALNDELNALRVNHVNIYTQLHRYSTDISLLIKPIIEKELIDNGKCILCNQKVDDNHDFNNNSNILEFTELKK